MENIFNKLIISMDDFFILNIEWDLYNYISNNLDKQNYQTFCWDLKNALTNNANEEYI
jgi:hypothetical protein